MFKTLIGCCFLIIMLSASGCTHTNLPPLPKAYLTYEDRIPLPVYSYPESFETKQLLNILHSGGKATLLCIVKADPLGISINGFSLSGVKIFEISFNERGLQAKSFIPLNQAPAPEQILLDCILGLYPENTLKSALSSEVELFCEKHVRLVKYRGKTVRSFLYDDDDSLSCIECPEFDYSIKIKSLK